MYSKNFIFLPVLILTMLNAKAQSYLSNGIFLCTQQDVDNFPVNYPGCTEIEGVLFIHGTSTSCSNNITNLNGLSQIVSRGGLNIDYTRHITDLSGLNNLTPVRQDVLIWDGLTKSVCAI